MLFCDIKPFIRFARYMTLNGSSSFLPRVPCDARFFYTVGGKGEITVDGKDIYMNKGDVLIINSGIEYRIMPPEEYVGYIVFNFDFTWEHSYITAPVPPVLPKNFLPESITEHTTFSDFAAADRYVHIQSIEAVQKRAAKIVREYTEKKIAYELKASCIRAEILADCMRRTEIQTPDFGSVADKVINYLQKNYNRPLTNIEIGSMFGLHPNYISKLIKQVTGIPLHRYILHVRLLHAIELMESGTGSIGDIALSCGFCDIYYFSRYFKSVMKMPPSEYIKR